MHIPPTSLNENQPRRTERHTSSSEAHFIFPCHKAHGKRMFIATTLSSGSFGIFSVLITFFAARTFSLSAILGTTSKPTTICATFATQSRTSWDWLLLSPLLRLLFSSAGVLPLNETKLFIYSHRVVSLATKAGSVSLNVLDNACLKLTRCSRSLSLYCLSLLLSHLYRYCLGVHLSSPETLEFPLIGLRVLDRYCLPTVDQPSQMTI